MTHTLNEFDILDLVDEAVDYGVNAWGGKKHVMALQIARFWIDGYIKGNSNLTEADKKSLVATVDNYFFI
jgi:hypothetical protein